MVRASAGLNARRHEVWGAACDRLRALLPHALDALEHALVEGKDWRAAVRVIELAGMDRQGSGVPNLGPSSIGSTDPGDFASRGWDGRRSPAQLSNARLDEVRNSR